MTSSPSVLKSAALIAGLSAIALSQATVPQLYVLSAVPGDSGLKQATVIPVAPLTLTRKDGRLYLGIDPAALGGVIVQLDGVPITTSSTPSPVTTLNIVSGPGIATTAIQAGGRLTLQISVAGGCIPDKANPPNWFCPGTSAPVPPAIPAIPPQ